MAASRFHWADYLVFIGVLAGTAIFGVIVGILSKRGKSTNTKDFVKGGGEMSALPVALSIIASFLSAPSILGSPAEVYQFGTMWLFSNVGYLLAAPPMIFLLLPIYHHMDLTSAYEYLERRFNKYVRLLGSITFVILMLLYMAVTVYAPAAAFSQVTGMDISFSILAVGLVCIFYTTVGGMKAAIYVDTVMMSTIFVGLIILIIVGTNRVGSFADVWNISKEGGRLIFDDFSPDPRERHSFWPLSIGMGTMTLSILGANQAMIQRLLTIKKVRQSQLSLVYAMIAMVTYTFIVVVLGLVIYAFYIGCDPITNKDVASSTQLLPLFLMEVLGHLHGLPGLISAAVFSATLSTVAAGIMGIAAVCVVDFIKPATLYLKGKPLGPKITLWSLRGITLLSGSAVIGMAYLTPLLGPTILQISLSVLGTVGGPMLGVFTLGIFFPFANSAGALVGGISALCMTFWVTIGAILQGSNAQQLPLSIEDCPVVNTSLLHDSMTTVSSYSYSDITSNIDILGESDKDGSFLYNLYSMSYLYYALLGVLTCWIVGIPVSLCSGLICKREEKIDPVLVYKYNEICRPCCNDRNPVGRCWMGPVSDESPDNMSIQDSEYKENKVGDSKSLENHTVMVDKLPEYSPYAKNGDVIMEYGGGGPCQYNVTYENGIPNKAFVPDNSSVTKL